MSVLTCENGKTKSTNDVTLSSLSFGDGVTLSYVNDCSSLQINDEIVATIEKVDEKIGQVKTSLEAQLASKVSSLEKEIGELRSMLNRVDPICDVRTRVFGFNLVEDR